MTNKRYGEFARCFSLPLYSRSNIRIAVYDGRPSDPCMSPRPADPVLFDQYYGAKVCSSSSGDADCSCSPTSSLDRRTSSSSSDLLDKNETSMKADGSGESHSCSLQNRQSELASNAQWPMLLAAGAVEQECGDWKTSISSGQRMNR
eukprot:2371903-Rhodomonas_salina.1